MNTSVRCEFLKITVSYEQSSGKGKAVQMSPGRDVKGLTVAGVEENHQGVMVCRQHKSSSKQPPFFSFFLCF